jgi:hypothetical protein
MAVGSVIYALLFVRKYPLEKVPTRALEDAFLYSAVAYEHGGPMQLPDDLWDAIGLELLCRTQKCNIDFSMAINWDILRFKATNLAIDFKSPACIEAERDMRVIEGLLGG